MPNTPAPIIERFWRYVTTGAGCWLWTGAVKDTGYGVLNVGRGKGLVRAHRLSWQIHFGPIPPGMLVCHRCDVRLCVNPNHLFLGTYRDNNLDLSQKGHHGRYNAAKTHCPHGHAFTPENTYVDKKGRRHCRLCGRDSMRRIRERDRMK